MGDVIKIRSRQSSSGCLGLYMVELMWCYYCTIEPIIDWLGYCVLAVVAEVWGPNDPRFEALPVKASWQ